MIEEYITQIQRFTDIKPETVLEVGALDGAYARTLQRSFGLREEDIYLVEPNPDLYNELVLQFPRAGKFNLALTDGQHPRHTFNKVISSNRDALGCSSLMERMDGWNFNLVHDKIEVPSAKGKALLGSINRPIDLCIIDVEGMTYDVLKSFEETLPSVKSLMVECEHREIFKGQKLYDDVRLLLEHSGFKEMAFRYSYPYQSDSVWIQKKHVVWFRPPDAVIGRPA